MRQAILHIGTTKTGSTSIQKVLRGHRAELPAQNAFYPLSPGRSAHVMLTFAVAAWPALTSSRGSKRKSAEFAARVDRFKTKFSDEMSSLPGNVTRVILSDERMSLLRTEAEIAALKELLQPYFDSFSVIIYLRSQDSYLASRYSELLRMGTVNGPDNEVATPARLWHYDYHAMIGRWADVFGKESMQPRIYERGVNRDFDSIDDFLAVCGVELDVPPDDPARSRNPSMSFAGQQVLLRMAALMQEQLGRRNIEKSLWHEISVAVSASVPGQGWLPTRQAAADFMKLFEASNEALRRLYFPDRTTLFADGSARFPLEPMCTTDAAMLQAACLAFLQSAKRVLTRAALKQGASGGRRKRRAAQDEDEDQDEFDDRSEGSLE